MLKANATAPNPVSPMPSKLISFIFFSHQSSVNSHLFQSSVNSHQSSVINEQWSRLNYLGGDCPDGVLTAQIGDCLLYRVITHLYCAGCDGYCLKLVGIEDWLDISGKVHSN